MAFLKVLKGSCPGQVLPLTGARMVLGRHPNCEIVVDNVAVSRHRVEEGIRGEQLPVSATTKAEADSVMAALRRRWFPN